MNGPPETIRPKPPVPRPAPRKRQDSRDDSEGVRAAEELERLRVERFKAAQAEVREAVESVRMPKVEAENPVSPPSVSPHTEQAVGRLVIRFARKAWPHLLAAILGTGAGATTLERTLRPELDAGKQNMKDANERADKADKRADASEARLVAVQVALSCRVLVLSSAAKRQGYDPGFESDANWNSEYLPDPRKPKAAPMWKSLKECPPLPLSPP